MTRFSTLTILVCTVVIMALCVFAGQAHAQDAVRFGVTLQTKDNCGADIARTRPRAHSSSTMFEASCSTEIGAVCNPYRGDTPCSTPLPLLCLLDIDAAVPATVSDDTHWTGAVLSLSHPIRGTALPSLADADRLCVQTFGEGWRVAHYRDGGGQGLVGFGSPPTAQQSVWVHIKGRPDATCWTR